MLGTRFLRAALLVASLLFIAGLTPEVWAMSTSTTTARRDFDTDCKFCLGPSNSYTAQYPILANSNGDLVGTATFTYNALTKYLTITFTVTQAGYSFASGSNAIKIYYCDASQAACQTVFSQGKISGLQQVTVNATRSAGGNAYGVDATSPSTQVLMGPPPSNPGLSCGTTYFMQLHVSLNPGSVTGFAGPQPCYVTGGAFYNTFKVTTGCCGGPGPTPPAPCSATEAATKNCEALNSPTTCTRYECVNTAGALSCEARAATAGTVCRAAAGVCDVPESCDGV